MPDLDIVALIKDVGFPIAVSIYLLYMIRSQTSFYGEKLDDIKDILTDMTTQISYMLSANINYRAGNTEIGDMMSKQAIYMGDRIKAGCEPSKEDGGSQ